MRKVGEMNSPVTPGARADTHFLHPPTSALVHSLPHTVSLLVWSVSGSPADTAWTLSPSALSIRLRSLFRPEFVHVSTDYPH